MKRFFTWIALGVIVFGAFSCTKDAEINARLDEQDAKIKNIASDVNNLKDLFNQLKDAQVNGYFILNVEEIKEGDTVLGWRISISNGKTIILMNGKDGKDGEDGEDGEDGTPGGTSEDVSVEELEDSWKITVGDDSITIPKVPEETVFSIKFFDTTYGAVAGETISYPFTITGLADGDELSVAAFASEGYSAVINNDNTAVAVTAPDPLVNGQIIVFAANGKGKADMKAITLTAADVSVEPGYQEAPASKEGDTVSVTVTTNVSYEIDIPVDWIHYDPTKGWTDHLTFTIDANHGVARNATVRLVAGDVVILSIPIAQAGGAEYSADITLGGNTAGIIVTVGEVSGDFAYLKAAVAETVDQALAIIDAGNGVRVDPGQSSTPLVPPVTGYNKVTFRAYDSSDNAIDYNFFTRLGLSAEDKATYCGTYEFTILKALTLNNRSNWVDLTANNPTYVENNYDDAHIVIAPSTDLNACIYEIPDFLGFGYDGCGNKSITEEVLIPNTWSLVDFSGVAASSKPLKASIYVAGNDILTLQIDGTTELFTIGAAKYYLTRDNKATTDAVYFDFGVDPNDGALTLTDGSGYYSLAIVSEEQVEAFDGQYRGNTSTVLFRGGESGYADRPVLKKKAE